MLVPPLREGQTDRRHWSTRVAKIEHFISYLYSNVPNQLVYTLLYIGIYGVFDAYERWVFLGQSFGRP